MPPFNLEEEEENEVDVANTSDKDEIAKGSENEDGDSEADEYVVEEIQDHKWQNGQWKYNVKWEGWSEDQNTWEPLENIIDLEITKEYLESIGGIPPPKIGPKRGGSGSGSATSKTDSKKRGRESTNGTSKKAGRPAKKTKTGGATEDSDGDNSSSIVETVGRSRQQKSAAAAAAKYPPASGSWDDHIATVITIANELEPATGVMHKMVKVCWDDGKSLSSHRLHVMHDRAPKSMLNFYERHLRIEDDDAEQIGEAHQQVGGAQSN